MNVSCPLAPPITTGSGSQAVVVVIGAGIIGCLTAWELAARGMPVLLLDRDLAGSGTTRRSAGLHLPRGGTERVRRMSGYSHAWYADLKRRHPDLPIYPVAATVHTTREGLGRYLPEACPQRMAECPEPHLVPAQDTAVSETAGAHGAAGGGTRSGGGTQPGWWRLAGSHYSDVYQLVQWLAARLRDGESDRATVAEGVSVTALESAGDHVIVRTGDGQRFSASGVVLAPGPWLHAPAWRDLLTPLGLRVKRIVALHIARSPTAADPAILFDQDDAFLLPLAHRGHWLFSYTCPDWEVDPDEPPPGVTARQLDAATAILRRHRADLPAAGLADAVAGGRVCCDAYSPAGEPVIQALDPAGRIVFAGAACGSGYRLAPAIAAQAAGAIAAQAAGSLTTEGADSDPQHVRRGRTAPLVRH